ncbi:Hypothetical predicted protein [Podarcis lilfordi]|uniref:Uncharacterized protein n=1 Tax=Podarcis lilfordi TaxID=74358 RepID=A0AA35QPY9_9SAUR|nr:Hypothetical predicted protein [Podarcis lilfordi]CAI7934961.1 Hypothetical predicted protein [Podarcis lilfordi]
MYGVDVPFYSNLKIRPSGRRSSLLMARCLHFGNCGQTMAFGSENHSPHNTQEKRSAQQIRILYFSPDVTVGMLLAQNWKNDKILTRWTIGLCRDGKTNRENQK